MYKTGPSSNSCSCHPYRGSSDPDCCPTAHRNNTQNQPKLQDRISDMKPAPLLLLLSLALICSHLRPAAGRPRSFPGWLDDRSSSSSSSSSFLEVVPQQQQQQLQQRLNQRLLKAAGLELLGDNMMGVLQRRNQEPLRLLETPESEEEEAVRATRLLLLKRSEEPPLSIDLTFHLLRNMIKMAKVESQRERALLNRKVLDEVGK